MALIIAIKKQPGRKRRKGRDVMVPNKGEIKWKIIKGQ